MEIGTVVLWLKDVGIVIGREDRGMKEHRWLVHWSDGATEEYYENTIYYHMEVICEGR